MTNELHDLHIDSVSLTKRGADQDAHVLLAKAAPPPAKEDRTMADLAEPIRKALGDETELTDEQTAAVSAVFDEARAEVPDGYVKAPEGKTGETGDGGDGGDAGASAEGAAGTAEPVDVTKSEPFVALQKSHDSLLRKTDERDFVDEHKAEYAHLPGDAVNITKAVYAQQRGDATPEQHETVRTAMAGASTAIAAGPVTTEIGTSRAEDQELAPLTTLAKAAGEADPKLDAPARTKAALMTEEGQKAYDRWDANRMAAAPRVNQ